MKEKPQLSDEQYAEILKGPRKWIGDKDPTRSLFDNEQTKEIPSAPTLPQLIMGEAIEHLQGRQLEVYSLMMREGKSSYEAAAILKLSDGAVKQYYLRAIRFISQYCQQAIKGGRV